MSFPVETPVTTPVTASTDTFPFEFDQVPPETGSETVMVANSHMVDAVADITEGAQLTVKG